MAKGKAQHYVFVLDGPSGSPFAPHALFSLSCSCRADAQRFGVGSSSAPLASLWNAWLSKVPDRNNSKRPASGEQVGCLYWVPLSAMVQHLRTPSWPYALQAGNKRKTSRLQRLPIGSVKGASPTPRCNTAVAECTGMYSCNVKIINFFFLEM